MIRAARVEGRLAGRCATTHHGLWDPGGALVVAVPEHSGRLWHPDVPCTPFDDRCEVRLIRDLDPSAPRFGASDLRRALREVALTEPASVVIAVGDSALRRTPMSRFDLTVLASELPPRARGIYERCSPLAESGTESILRVLLEDQGVRVTAQARLPGTDLGRVDLLVGDRLIIECDSAAHHDGAQQRLRDLRRDAALAALGYIVLRFDYRQIMNEPRAVVAAVLRYVEHGLHHTRPLTIS